MALEKSIDELAEYLYDLQLEGIKRNDSQSTYLKYIVIRDKWNDLLNDIKNVWRHVAEQVKLEMIAR